VTHDHEGATTGTVLGRYRLETVLGTGGMASVWKGRDERLGRTVAVKVLSETLALEPDYVERFNREAQIAAGLSHPNLVPVFDFGSDAGQTYLVSEFVDGETLAERLQAGGAIDAGRLARQLLGALHHIHEAGVIHRDVKPANILLDPDGHARLTDFGVAQPKDGARLTETGKLFGTLGYIPPEVQAGGVASEAADLFAAGVVIRESLGNAPAASDLTALVEQLTAEDPARRPPTAAAALGLLDQGRGPATLPVTRPLPAAAPLPPTELRSQSGRSTQPRRAAAVLGLLCSLAALGFVVAGAFGGDDGADQPLAKSEKQKPKPRAAPAQAAPQPKVPTPTPTPSPIPVSTPSPDADPCAVFDFRRRRLEEKKKGIEPPGHGGGPPGQLKHFFDEQKHAAEEQFKACTKALEDGGHDWRGGHDDGD
jgi:eukaryotic-like serine/threonine-protein kinase